MFVPGLLLPKVLLRISTKLRQVMLNYVELREVALNLGVLFAHQRAPNVYQTNVHKHMSRK